jgi:Domain of unknown function (DUF4296)
MIKAFFVSFLVLIVTSCSPKKRIPQDVLPQPQMQAVLWDMLRTDEFVMNYFKNDSVRSKKDESTKLYEEVFRIHKTNREQFKKSMNFYNGHPDLLKVVLDSLENRKNTIIQDVYKKPLVPDSARKRPRPAFVK